MKTICSDNTTVGEIFLSFLVLGERKTVKLGICETRMSRDVGSPRQMIIVAAILFLSNHYSQHDFEDDDHSDFERNRRCCLHFVSPRCQAAYPRSHIYIIFFYPPATTSIYIEAQRVFT